MKIKKRLKYKSTLPKADFGMNASNRNRAAAEETPAEGGGMGAGAALGIANGALDFVTSFAPKDNNDGIGISHKGSAISKGITGGLHAGADMAKAVPGIGTIVGGAMDAAATIGEFITGMVDKVRENDRTKVSRLAKKEYDPTNNNTGYSFGTRATPSATPVFGGQADAIAKYGMPLFGDGGETIKYKTDFRPATSYEQKYNKETGLWEVGGAKPKPVVATKTKVPQKVEPIYVTDPNDSRLKSYQDSTKYYNNMKRYNFDGFEAFGKTMSLDEVKQEVKKYNPDFHFAEGASGRLNYGNLEKDNANWSEQTAVNKYKKGKHTVEPVGWRRQKDYGDTSGIVQGFNNPSVSTGAYNYLPVYKKPVQPVIYQKQEVSVPVPKKNFNNIKEKQDILGDNIQYENEPTSQTTEESKGKPLNDFLKQQRKNPNGGVNTYIRKDTKSPWLQQDFALGGDPNVDNILKTNKNLDWVKRLYEDNTPSITLKGQTKPSTHFMESSDNLVYPTIVRNADGKLEYLGDKARDYAVKTNTAIKLANEQDATWFGENYKKGTGVLKGFNLGGDPRAQSNIEAEQGEAMQHSSGKIEAIGGKKHPQGGTPLQVQPSHEYIYSDSLGRDKNGNITLNEKDVVKSFADDAKSIQRKYSKREGDPIVDKTKELELALLKQDAEQARVAKEKIEMGKQMKKYKAKYGANLKKFANSGYVPFTNFPSQYGDEEVDPNSTLAMQQKLLKYNPNALSKYGPDGIYGNETKQGFLNNPGVYNMIAEQEKTANQIPTPSFGGGTGYKNNFIGPNMPSSRYPRGGFGPYPQGQIGTPLSRASASLDQRSIAPEVADKVKNGMFDSLTTGDKMQLASMLPAFGFNLGMGLRKADVEPNRKNLYEKDVVNIMQNRKFDIQNYLNQANLATNTAKEDIGNNSTSVGGKMANIQKLYANSLNSLGDITTKGQEMNNQYRAEEANTKNIIGEANRAESIRAAGINDQNKARKQQFLAKAFEQLGQGIATTGQSANQSLTNKLLIKSLSEISPDFDVKNMKDMEVDNDGYIVFKGQKTKFKMSDEGKIVMAGGTPNTANAAKSQYAPKDFTMKAFANFTKTKTTK